MYPVFHVPSLLLPSSLGPGFMPKPFTESKEREAKLLVPESQECRLKRRGGLCARSSLQDGTGAGGGDGTGSWDSNERAELGKGAMRAPVPVSTC